MSIHLTVATVIKRKNSFLVVRETTPNRPKTEVINQPAGHVELGETLQEAAVRETLEETGWHCEISHAIGIYHYLSPASRTQYLRICFAANLISQAHLSPPDPNILSAEWMTLKDIEAIHNKSALRPKQGYQREALRSPIVLTCFQDFERDARLPWHCLQEQALMTDRATSITPTIQRAQG